MERGGTPPLWLRWMVREQPNGSACRKSRAIASTVQELTISVQGHNSLVLSASGILVTLIASLALCCFTPLPKIGLHSMKTKLTEVPGSIVAPHGFLTAGVFCDIKRLGTGKGSNKGRKRDL